VTIIITTTMKKNKILSSAIFTTFCFGAFAQLTGVNHTSHVGHHHHDSEIIECREIAFQQIKKLAESTEFNREFEEKFSISTEQFTKLNPVDLEFLKNKLSDDVCKNGFNSITVKNQIFDFISNNSADLLFKPVTNLEPGTILLGKHYRTTNSNPFPSLRAADEPCNNADFETCDFTGWETYCGGVNANPFQVVGLTQYNPAVSTCGSGTSPHLVVTGGNDPVIPSISRVNPNGGGCSVRLGDGTNSNYGGAVLRQTFLVDASSTIFSYSYAAVLETPGSHTTGEMPFFGVRVFDENNVEIDCGAYAAYAGDGQPGWQTSGSISYLPWTTVFASLGSYIGQNVTIEFSTGDCGQGAHYGYAYVEASCGGLELISSAGAICAGDPVILTAPGGAATYTWNTTENTQSIIVDQPGTYTVNVIPTQGAQCAINLSIDIEQNPYPTAIFTGAPLTVCALEEIEFTDNSDAGLDQTISTWQWDFGNGESTSAGSGTISNENFTTGTYDAPTHNFQNGGDFTVTLTVVNSGGCSNSTTLDVIVNSLPNISAGPDINICENVPVILSGTGGVDYLWDNGVVDGIEFNPPAGVSSYTVTGVDANGCENTDDVTINVEAAPIIDAGEDQVLCFGESVVLSASGGSNYVWSDGVQNGVQFSPNETNTYTVTYTSAIGCEGTDEVTVTVNPLPIITAENVVTCANLPVVLSGSGGVSYSWSGGVIDGQSFIPGIGVNNYTVIGTDANGCENSAGITVTVYTYPNADFSATPTSGVPPLEVTITNLSNGLITDYSWNFGNGNSSTENFDQHAEVYYNQGNPIITLIVSNQGCNDTMSIILNIQYTPVEYNIPNVFTPNNDQVNDFFHLSLVNAAEVELLIFNRWGNLMAEISDINHPGWDGRTPSGDEASEGVYFHKYRIIGLNGEEVEGHGFLHLVRN